MPQQKRIEDCIPDRRYYESEEFQSLLGLVIERLHTTHDEEKLRMFGDALANAGSTQFQPDEKDDYIRTLRDLSINELRVLKQGAVRGRFSRDGAGRIGRLLAMDLVTERLEEKRTPLVPRGADSNRMAQALRELITKPPERIYSVSPLGFRFLNFIAAKEPVPAADKNTA